MAKLLKFPDPPEQLRPAERAPKGHLYCAECDKLYQLSTNPTHQNGFCSLVCLARNTLKRH